MPAASRTARTAPPAMTPVPSPAGLSSTRPAPKWPSTSCGMVVPGKRNPEQVLLRLLAALADGLGDLVGLAEPDAHVPEPSPTTTSAEKLNRRPPLTTLATRLMWTTRSVSSRSFGVDRSQPVQSPRIPGTSRA